MSTVLLVILLMLTVIMTGLILIQRSEGGALGIGGGGGGGGFMSGRAAGTSIARATAVLGTIFLILSLLLSVFFARENRNDSRINADGEVGGLTQPSDSPDGADPLEPSAPAIETILDSPSDTTAPDTEDE